MLCRRYIDDMKTAKASLTQAKQQLTLAKKSGFAWNTTVKLVDKSQSSFDKGDFTATVTFANKAVAEAKNSLIQAKESQDNWQDNIVK